MTLLRSLACAVLVAAVPGAGGAAGPSAGEAGAVARAGCLVRTTQVDARGVATVAAECRWPLTVDAVVATIRNPAKLADALSSLADCRRLPDGRVLQVHSPGWPLGDRQVTLDWHETELPGGGMRFEYQRAQRQEPLAAGRVAIGDHVGRWEILPDPHGGTRLSYTSHYDAGGSLKPWLVRRFQKDGVASSLAELRAAATSE
jgi:hypothetical protein